MERKTLGGSKKLVFAPKKPKLPTTFNNDQPPHTNIKLTHKKSTFIPKDLKAAFVPFKDASNGLNHTFIIENKAETKDIDFHAADEPQLLLPPDDEVVNFNDDVMYLFSGIDECGEILVDGNVCSYSVNNKTCEMVIKEFDEMCVVHFENEDVFEIGNVYNGFVACRKEI